MEKIIEFKNVSFAYDETQENTIKNLNVDFYEGQFTCVLGHNGSGKSTMAKLINALLVPLSGNVITYA
jgi:energy-coupling factor transport system ATP-binding protein